MRINRLIILFINVMLCLSISACGQETIHTAIDIDDNECRLQAKDLFTAYAGVYYINNSNELYYYNGYQTDIILTNIIKIFDGGGGTFAIDKNGDVWGWNCEWLNSETPKKIEGLKNVKTVVSVSQMINGNFDDTFEYSVFLLENGEIYISGEGIDSKNTFVPLKVFNYSEPKKINYKGKAKDIWDVGYGDFQILMDNNDLYRIDFKNNFNRIKQTFILARCKECMKLDKFYIVVTEEGYYGWGEIVYFMEDESATEQIIQTPTKLAGMEPVLICSDSLAGMKDGTVWYRKHIGKGIVGEQIQEIEDVIYLKDNVAMTANGALYILYYQDSIKKIAETNFNFTFEKSKEKYNFNINDDFWKYGGFSQ